MKLLNLLIFAFAISLAPIAVNGFTGLDNLQSDIEENGMPSNEDEFTVSQEELQEFTPRTETGNPGGLVNLGGNTSGGTSGTNGTNGVNDQVENGSVSSVAPVIEEMLENSDATDLETPTLNPDIAVEITLPDGISITDPGGNNTGNTISDCDSSDNAAHSVRCKFNNTVDVNAQTTNITATADSGCTPTGESRQGHITSETKAMIANM